MTGYLGEGNLDTQPDRLRFVYSWLSEGSEEPYTADSKYAFCTWLGVRSLTFPDRSGYDLAYARARDADLVLEAAQKDFDSGSISDSIVDMARKMLKYYEGLSGGSACDY